MATSPQRIIILGGGFGGVYTALHLAQIDQRRRRRGKSEPIEIVLVSRDNFFLITPLLFEAGSGVLEPRHAVAPVRSLFLKYKQIRFVNAEVIGVDFDRRIVSARPADSQSQETYDLPYDHLVIALGGTTNVQMIPGSDNAFTFKTLADAIFLRNHVIDLFERADVEKDPQRKKTLLTFVVIGGGLVAVELVGEMTEFLSNLARVYRNIDYNTDIRFEMFEAAGRIMGEMDEPLSQYATARLEARGVKVRVNTPVKSIEPHTVHLKDNTSIQATTIVLAAGITPSPIVTSLNLPKDRKGRVIVEATMRCPTRPEVWALGDFAMIPDPEGKPYPQLAQHALREAKVLAANIIASMENWPLKPFVYKTMGMLAALGHYQGVGRIWKIRIYGFTAWWVWRTYYLFQMPRWNRRWRVVLDWTVALLFKNDIVKLDLFGKRHPVGRYDHVDPVSSDVPGKRQEIV